MAERPGVVKLGKHGLFSQTDEPIDLDKAAEEVACHEGYIWTHIVSLHREDIKEKSEQKIRDLIAQAETESTPNAQLQFLFVKLRKQLDHHKGKKVYGYLPKAIKTTVNEIVTQLSSEPAIEELYKEWNKVNREKLSLYYENKDPTVSLVDNKEFRSIKNMIIKAVMEMTPDAEITHSAVSEEDNDEELFRIRTRFYDEETEPPKPILPNPPPIVTHYEEHIPFNTIAAAKGIIGASARLIGDKCMAHRQSLQGQIDYRLKQQINEQINEKKLAMGLKIESTQTASYQTEEEYEQSM